MTTTSAPLATHPEVDPDVDLREGFRAAMGSVAASVAVVTTVVDDELFGTTVSAFMSLSMDPPMLLVSLMQTSRLLSVLRPDAVVGVNVLASHQGEVATLFAQRRDDKFDHVAWTSLDGAPALDERHAWAAIRVAQLVPAGDHTLVLGDVLAASAADHTPPLIYWRRTYGTHRAH